MSLSIKFPEVRRGIEDASIDEIVAVNIRERMTALNMNQKKLALLAGLSPAYVNKLLTGKKQPSKSHSLGKVAKALEVREAELYQALDLTTQRAALDLMIGLFPNFLTSLKDAMTSGLSEKERPQGDLFVNNIIQSLTAFHDYLDTLEES